MLQRAEAGVKVGGHRGGGEGRLVADRGFGERGERRHLTGTR